jgi:hypothetical protein
MKEETIEEAFEKWSAKKKGYDKLDVLRFGPKWQSERMYSEEEVLDLILARDIYLGICESSEKVEQWFEQFSKLKNG